MQFYALDKVPYLIHEFPGTPLNENNDIWISCSIIKVQPQVSKVVAIE